LFASAGK